MAASQKTHGILTKYFICINWGHYVIYLQNMKFVWLIFWPGGAYTDDVYATTAAITIPYRGEIMNHDYIGSFWQCQMSQKALEERVSAVCLGSYPTAACPPLLSWGIRRRRACCVHLVHTPIGEKGRCSTRCEPMGRNKVQNRGNQWPHKMDLATKKKKKKLCAHLFYTTVRDAWNQNINIKLKLNFKITHW